ncbi:unnamed protein product [Gongylonema pulchrum]|uniref:Mg_chelatase_C domain-containing protein n=1 Tax=Gongylonema pulchrum TaxID=637853 RepID=A0A183CX49_9BILA|nr:unnamed protein product [Gongylonema pulchrum]
MKNERRRAVCFHDFHSIADFLKMSNQKGHAHLFHSAVLEAMMQACETSSFTKAKERALFVTGRAMERRMLRAPLNGY